MPESATCSVRDRALRVLGELPPFSPILNRLMASLAQQDVSFAKVADLIEKDAVLAGNVLKLVNSALYGRRASINSVRHAVSMLGVNKLRNATLGMSVARMWNKVKTPRGWSTASFNLHSVAVAMLSDLLAQKLPVNYGEGAFVAGLFHDLGWLLLVLGCPEEFDRASHSSAEQLESETLGISHAELSAEALAIWNLPLPIQMAVRYHAQWERDPNVAEVNRVPLSRVVSVADHYVRQRGNAISIFEHGPDPSVQLTDFLGLGERLPIILDEFENEFSAIQQFF